MSPPADAPRAVGIVAVDEAVLERMVRAAMSDASANEVTPPVTPGEEWTPARVEWMRTLHRQCRAGLDGPAGQATWAVVVGGQVVGSVRLKRTDTLDVLETGIWLTRSARGRGVGRQSISAVLEQAAAAGSRVVRAETSAGNQAALAVLYGLGFECSATSDGERVVAQLALHG